MINGTSHDDSPNQGSSVPIFQIIDVDDSFWCVEVSTETITIKTWRDFVDAFSKNVIGYSGVGW